MNNHTIENYIDRHEQYLQKIISGQEIPSDRLKQAMTYVLFPGGKRIRPLLVYLCGELMNISTECLDTIAVAIEITHCYSLVHDDLPSMDNDDMRRGKLSCHRAFDEATAILVGDGLQALAIDILLHDLPNYLSPSQVIAVIKELIYASGPAGMISGQCFDLYELAKPTIDKNLLCYIHNLKTGRLISACINMVIAASHSNDLQVQYLRNYAANLGLVFQMQDDYLDNYADPSVLGKGRSSDQQNGKSTFAHHYPQQELIALIDDYYVTALNNLQYFADASIKLQILTRKLQDRIKL